MKIAFLFRHLAILAVTAGVTAGLFAQNANPANQDKDCNGAATTSAMRSCENTRYDAAQLELNSVYQSLLKSLDGAQKERLRVAQRAWLRFRETNAEFQASLAQGGTLGPLIRIASLTEMTKARTAELKNVSLP